jgi:hypothetical protein
VLVAHDQVGRIVGGDEVAAAGRIGEMPVQHVDQRLRLVDIARFAGRLEERHAGARHVGIVVERAAMQPLAEPRRMEQSSVLIAHRVHHEAPGAARGGEPVVAPKHGGGIGERGDHQPFQSASTLSSQPGHTRLSRTAFSLAQPRQPPPRPRRAGPVCDCDAGWRMFPVARATS